jgi:hypothetical protein
MPELIIGKIKDGQIKLRKDDQRTIAKNEGKEVLVEIAPADVRTQKQNAYLWGVIYKVIADYTGFIDQEIHELFKEKFLNYTKVKWGKLFEFTKSTASLGKGDFSIYVESIRQYCRDNESLKDLVIPDPDPEWWLNQ